MPEDLKSKAVNSAKWSLIERFGNQGIQFFFGLVLARLLFPEEFGLVGMLMLFITVSETFVDSGFSLALIRKKDATDEDFSTAFWFNLIIALLFYAIIFVTAPFISAFYNEPKLTILARVLALSVVVNAFGLIQKTKLTKVLDFETQAKISLASIFIAGIAGIVLAWLGYGVWALIVQTLVRNVFINLSFWFNSSWRPLRSFSKKSFDELFGFGSKILVSSIIYTLSDNLYILIIGKLFSAKNLGYYTRANQFQKLPVSSIYGAITVVSFPVLSEIQDDNQKLKSAFQSVIKVVCFLLFPIMAILGAVADPLISIVLTDKWLPSVPLLQVLCIVGAFYPLHAINMNVLNVKGRSDLYLKLEVIKQSLNIVVVFICYRWNVIGLVWGLVALNVICYFLNSFFSKSLVGYSFLEQLKDIFIFALMTGIMLVALFFIRGFITNRIAALALIPLFGATIYIGLASLFKVKEISTIVDVFKRITRPKAMNATA